MPDGTLMEWGVKSVTTGTATGPLGYYGSEVVQFSPVFASAPMVTVSASDSAGFWNAAVHGVKTSQANVTIAGNHQNETKNVYWHAIGRWK